MEVIASMLDKILSVAIVDPGGHRTRNLHYRGHRSLPSRFEDPSVRGTVLASLEQNLDFQLSQAEYIRLLVIAIHDEVVDNRIMAVQVLGRLASHNPAQVSPSLQKTLIRLLTELRYCVTP